MTSNGDNRSSNLGGIASLSACSSTTSAAKTEFQDATEKVIEFSRTMSLNLYESITLQASKIDQCRHTTFTQKAERTGFFFMPKNR